MPHFNNLTPGAAERLAVLAEECGEVIQAVSKIQRHGYDSGHPRGDTSNVDDLEYELKDQWLIRFVEESNRIEDMHEVLLPELEAHKLFLEQPIVTTQALERFVGVVQPGALLREHLGQNVQVGDHVALPGGWRIAQHLLGLLSTILERTPYENHVLYEDLHPFTDGNGRSGRALWLWQTINHGTTFDAQDARGMLFLHTFYYQSLRASRLPRIERPWEKELHS